MQDDISTRSGDLLTISEVSARYRITLRTLRFYEERQLIQPTRVGLRRFYSPKDSIRLELILTGKRLGFSLREIESFIESHQSIERSDRTALVDALDPDTVLNQIAALERQKAAVEAAILELKNALEAAT